MASGNSNNGDQIAQSLRQATQLLLRAAEQLQQNPPPVTPPAAPPRSSPASSSSIVRPRITNFQPVRRRTSVPRFRPYQQQVHKKWQHTFVCLSQVDQFFPPDTNDRVRLVQAGLGEKKISVNPDGTAENLHAAVLDTYPCLRDGGGYEFMKIDESSRKCFSVVPPSSRWLHPTLS